MRAVRDHVEQAPKIRLLNDAGAVLADLDLYKNRNGHVFRRKDPLRLRHLTRRIHAEGDTDAALYQRRDAPQLRLPHDLVCDKDVPQAVFRHHLGLAGLCHRNAAGALPELHLGDLGRFVRLCVRTELHAVFLGVALHVRQIFHQPLPVDQQSGRVQFQKLHCSRLLFAV